MGSIAREWQTSFGRTQSPPPEETPDIEPIHEENNIRSDIQLIPPSRFSAEFREYLETAKMNVHPGIFPDKDWNNSKRKGKPVISTINKNDLSIIWNEVRKLGAKYKYERLCDWMPVHYFLSSCLLKAKIDCLESVEVDVSPEEKNALVVKDAKRMLVFQDFIMKEMMHRYIEMTYEEKTKENGIQLDGASRKRKRD